MPEKKEDVFYDKNGVRITNLRAVFASHIYAFAEDHITWVKQEKVDSSGGLAQVTLVIGILVMAVGFAEDDVLRWVLVGIGLILAVVGGYWQKSQKKEYLLTFGSAYREISGYRSTNDD